MMINIEKFREKALIGKIEEESNLTSFENMTNLETGLVTDMRYMFADSPLKGKEREWWKR